jgi:flagellin-like hook-associated protein FlgL
MYQAKPLPTAIGQVQQFASSVTSSQGAIGGSLSRRPAWDAFAIQRENVVSASLESERCGYRWSLSNYVNAQVRQQVSVAVLAQANQTPSLALRLLA